MQQAFTQGDLHLFHDFTPLFPLPAVAYSNKNYALEALFELLGLILARAILDNRILQIRLAPSFWKIVLSRTITWSDFHQLDSQLATVIQKIDESNVEEMDLVFEMPGTGQEIVPNGRDLKVGKHNLQEFKNSLLEWYMIKSIHPQLTAFKKGFNKVTLFYCRSSVWSASA